MADPSQDFKSVQLGHFEIKQKQFREGIFGAIGIFSVAAQVRDDFLAIFDNEQWIENAALKKSSADNYDVIVPVFSEKDYSMIRHNVRFKSMKVNHFDAVGDGVFPHLAQEVRGKGTEGRGHTVGAISRRFGGIGAVLSQ